SAIFVKAFSTATGVYGSRRSVKVISFVDSFTTAIESSSYCVTSSPAGLCSTRHPPFNPFFSVGTPFFPRIRDTVRCGLDQLPKSFSMPSPKNRLQSSHSYSVMRLLLPKHSGIACASWLKVTLGTLKRQKRQTPDWEDRKITFLPGSSNH